MATVEDVFSLYERNLYHYNDCKKQNKLETCTTKHLEECYCSFSIPVRPFLIGENTINCNIKRKCYIKPGEICPICLDEILTKKSAYLTRCGHPFHKKCILDSMDIYSKKIHRCPMCRQYLCMDILDIDERYNIILGENHKVKNYLDLLENFWIKKDCTLPVVCSYNHYLGMKKNCPTCKKYISSGNLL
jgi:hypothetical protein